VTFISIGDAKEIASVRYCFSWSKLKNCFKIILFQKLSNIFIFRVESLFLFCVTVVLRLDDIVSRDCFTQSVNFKPLQPLHDIN